MYQHHQGDAPLLINIPHCGTRLPESYAKQMTNEAYLLRDTDWHLERLYGFAKELGVHVLHATTSRYVIDLNRPPDDSSLYPGLAGTGLCPATNFNGESLYLENIKIDQKDRLQKFWWPYHDKLQTILSEIKKEHGYAILLDGHSIRSQVPRLFDGVLPDLNLGTDDGNSCDASLRSLAVAALTSERYSLAVDARFKGGYITRHYGQPDEKIHALQLEKSQINYMNEEVPFNYLQTEAERFTKPLHKLVSALTIWTP